jgi:hypothetical protein
MKIILFVFFSLFAFFSRSQESPKPIPPLDSLTVKRAAFIASVKMQQTVNDLIECTIIDSYKGGKSLDDHFLLRVGDDRASFMEGDIYLIFAKEDDGLKYYIDKNSRILRQEDSEKDIAYLLSKLPCFDPKLKELNKNMPCHRIYRPVCGCDSKTYSTPCGALNNGIVIFSKGACKE